MEDSAKRARPVSGAGIPTPVRSPGAGEDTFARRRAHVEGMLTQLRPEIRALVNDWDVLLARRRAIHTPPPASTGARLERAQPTRFPPPPASPGARLERAQPAGLPPPGESGRSGRESGRESGSPREFGRSDRESGSPQVPSELAAHRDLLGRLSHLERGLATQWHRADAPPTHPERAPPSSQRGSQPRPRQLSSPTPPGSARGKALSSPPAPATAPPTPRRRPGGARVVPLRSPPVPGYYLIYILLSVSYVSPFV
jgi:hypothetical protein